MADLRTLLESALSQHIAAATSATVYTGTDNDTKAAPCVIVAAGAAEEEIPNSGIYKAPAAVLVKSVAFGDTGAHDTLCAAVRTAFKVDDAALKAALEGYESGLVVFGTGEEDRIETEQDGDVWSQAFVRSVIICEAA